MGNDNKNPLVKKADSLLKFDPQKRKELIVRGLKETDLIKTILLLDFVNHVHSLLDEEFREVFGNKIKLAHFYSPTDAFNYLISHDVHLVISCVMLPADVKARYPGITFLRVVKTLYPKLPFVFYTAVDYRDDFAVWASDAYILKSSDLSELLESVRNLLDDKNNTEECNSKIKAGDIQTLLNLGNAYTILKMYGKAIEAFKNVTKLDLNIAEAYHNLGGSYHKLDMNKEAIEAFVQAIRIQPDNADAYHGLGFSYLKLDMNREAIEAFGQAIRIQPDNAGAYYGLGIAYLVVKEARL